MSYRRRLPAVDDDDWQRGPMLPPLQISPEEGQVPRQTQLNPSVKAKTFACPFSKRNVSESANIWCRPMRTEDWTTVTGVIEHICTRHHPPILDSLRVLHNLDGSLSPAYIPPTIPLINGRQWKSIRSLSFWGPESSKWYEIWDILFPDWPRPSSPFLGDDDSDSDHRSETLSFGAAPRGTPTDSGYASASALVNLQQRGSPDSGASQDPDSKAGDEDGTIYSTVTTAIPQTVQESIVVVCEAIYDQMKTNFNANDFKTDSPLIPWIIKAFAVELGLEHSSTGSSSLGIMHFVHKHHGQISSQLRRIFHSSDREGDGGRSNEKGGMSLVDKMNLWGRKFVENQEEADFEDRDLFVGVEDEDVGNEPDDSHIFSGFTKEIFQTRAYTALIGRVMTELSLHRAEAEGSFESATIRHTVLRELPTGTISKNRPPTTYTVTFRLPWTLQNVDRESIGTGSACRISPGEDLGKRIVLVLSAPDQIQATTVRNYLQQTWPLDGAQVLRLLHETLRTPPGPKRKPYTGTSLDGRETKVTLSTSGLILHVSGPPHFIAERGEMLAWLAAAIQEATLSGVQSIPMIEDDQGPSALVTQLQAHRHWRLAVKQQPLTASQSSLLVEKIQKYGIVQGFPIAAIKGYPTQYRPRGYPGVEISPRLLAGVVWSGLSHTMQALVLEGMGRSLPWVKPAFTPGNGMTSLRALNTGLFLNGNDPRSFPPALKLLRRKGNVMFWHAPLFTPACYCLRIASHEDDSNWSAQGPQSIHQHRHIITVCPSESPGRECDTLKAPLVSSIPADSKGQDSAFTDIADEGERPTSSIANESNPGDLSTESEAFSMSDSSTSTVLQALPLDRILDSTIDRIVSRLIANYRSKFPVNMAAGYIQHHDNDNASDRQSGGPTPDQAVFNTQHQRRRSKRSIEEEAKGNSEDESHKKRPNKRQKIEEPQSVTSRKFLACPFWKLDPREHRDCFKMKLDKISRVKQHLTRKHHPMFYCERCMLVLQTEEAHLRHIQIMKCSFQSERFVGITNRQQRELSKKSNPSLSESDQWFAIWGIVFPNIPRPVSAYMDADLSEDLCRFREFANLHGPRLIGEEIQSSGLQTLEGDAELALQHAISRGLNTMFENWLGDRPRNNSQATTTSAQMLSSQGNENSDTNYTLQQQASRGSMSSHPDSGVAMPGYQMTGDQGRPRLFQPAATSWPASFHTFSLSGFLAPGEDRQLPDEQFVPPTPIPIIITEDAPSPRANTNVGNPTAASEAGWEEYLNELFPGGSGLT